MKVNDLYQQALNGDSIAADKMFGILRERFSLFLQLRVSNQQDREDLLQEILAVIASKYKVEEKKDNFSGWAYRVLENKVLHYYRQKKSRREKEVPMELHGSASKTSPDYLLKINLKSCLKMMHKKNKRYTEILSQHYQGFSSEEICQNMKINKNSMYILLSRAREMLRVCLDDKKDRL